MRQPTASVASGSNAAVPARRGRGNSRHCAVRTALWRRQERAHQDNAPHAASRISCQVRSQVFDFEPDDAEEAGDIRAALERAGTPIGPYDVLIAAQARRRGAMLVTANRREFARVPRLKTEDWAAA